MTGFADALKKLTDKAKGDLEKAARQAMFLGAQGVVLKCPVDTGRLRGSFVFGAGAPKDSAGTSPDKGGAATLARIKGGIDNAQIGGVWYVTSNLPYAKVAEYGLWGKPPGSANGPKTSGGYSSQAPAGFVRLTVQELPDMIRQYMRDLSS